VSTFQNNGWVGFGSFALFVVVVFCGVGVGVGGLEKKHQLAKWTVLSHVRI
jgi:uncharacterized membrane protein